MKYLKFLVSMLLIFSMLFCVIACDEEIDDEELEETEEDDYKFKLREFEGPLDLLVHLIKITKIDDGCECNSCCSRGSFNHS